MPGLVRQLLFDLRQRCGFLAEQLTRLSGVVPAEAESYRDGMTHRVERTAELIQGTLDDPGLEHPQLAKQFFHAYKRFAELLHEIESGPVVALKHFGEGDRLMTKLVAEICRDIGYPDSPPLCSALSADYYWALPDMDLIFVPCAEPFHLLALPDLYHELAHFLLERYEAELVQPVLELVDEHFDRAVLAAGQNGWPQPSIDAISEAGIAWWNHWCLEFASDMLATYWVGPAFGWANIRVCTNLGDELFVGGSAHPADDARCAAIRFMLEHVGQVDAAASVETVWSELVTLSGQQAPQAYELTYPTDLLRQMARVMSHAAAQMNLVAFDDEDASSKECLSRLLNSAWETFLSAPEAFAAFERTQIESLKSQLGILR